jgi:hypothetical protein
VTLDLAIDQPQFLDILIPRALDEARLQPSRGWAPLPPSPSHSDTSVGESRGCVLLTLQAVRVIYPPVPLSNNPETSLGSCGPGLSVAYILALEGKRRLCGMPPLQPRICY